MKTLKLIILITLMGTISLSYAQSSQPTTACIQKEKTTAPPLDERTTTVNGQQVDTPVWATWKTDNSNWQTSKDWGCCQGLVKDPSGKCSDTSPVDPSIQSCTSHSQCLDGKGCLPFREEMMFSNNEGQEDTYEQFIENMEYEQKEIGGLCFIDAHCESNKCDGMTCKENNVCRLADTEDLPTPSSVKCDVDLIKNPQGVCVSESPEYYSSLLTPLVVKEKSNGQGGVNKCQYELVQSEFDPTQYTKTNEEIVKDAIDLAILTSRGLEWVLGTATQPRDCMHSINYWKEKVPPLIEKRKLIVADYNSRFNNIEKTYKKVLDARVNDHQTMIRTLCGQEEASAHTIAARISTGQDFLCYMRKRNEAFMVYESSMKAWAKEFSGILNLYHQNIKDWGNNDKNWMVGDASKSWENAHPRACRGYWINLLFGTLAWKKIKNRYEERYTVRSTASAAPLFQESNISNYLKAVGGEQYPKRFYALPFYYLFDFLQSGGSQFQNTQGSYGSAVSGRSSRIRKFNGNTLMTMRDRHRRVAENHLKNFYVATSGVQKEDYVVEPDMRGGYDARGCHEGGGNCEAYQKYLSLLNDIGFAQSMTYSHHTKHKTKDYYTVPASGRRKLFERAETDFLNLDNYYTALADLRTKQNACIDQYLENLNHSDFNDTGANLEGESNNYFLEGENDYVGITNPNQPVKPNVGNNKYSVNKYDLNTSTNILKASGATNSTIGNIKGEGATVGNATNAAMAARVKKLQDANKKAAKENPEYVKQAGNLITSLGDGQFAGKSGSGLSMGSGSSSSTGKGSSLTGLSNSISATLSDDKDKNKDSDEMGKSKNASNQGLGNKGPGANPMKSIFGSSISDSASGYTDPTGMSDEEKDIMSKNYERNKGKYNPRDEDSLFQVVSKTYMRNLDRVLTRKKRIEEN